MGRLTLFLAATAAAAFAAAGPAQARPLSAEALSSVWTGAVLHSREPPALTVAPPGPALIGAPEIVRGPRRLQCAIYARTRTGLALFGAAASWWAKARGLYQRSAQPQEGAVIVLGGTRSGHVAVVSHVVSPREILVDHANWANRGEITLGALMVDVSPANDWSRVRVWHAATNGLGRRGYPVYGFILPTQV